MDRRAFLGAMAGGFLAAPLAAQVQPPGKVARIGMLSQGSPTSSPQLREAFRQQLREFGYVEEQNLVIEYRWTGLGEPLTKLAAELVGLKLDLIVSVSHRVSLEVKRATSTIPVIFAHVNDPVGVGLVPSLAHPGGNVTGLSAQGLDPIAKRLELLKELFPSVFRRVPSRGAASGKRAGSERSFLDRGCTCSARSRPIPTDSMPRAGRPTTGRRWRWPNPAACGPSSPTATSASASSTGARASGRRRRNTSPPRPRCIARWA